MWFAFPKSGKVLCNPSMPVDGEEGLLLPSPGPLGYEEKMREPCDTEQYAYSNQGVYVGLYVKHVGSGPADKTIFNGLRPIVRRAACDTLPPVVGGEVSQ